ncbi:hypothetical protein N0V95_000709 [Ascochyta clinopodiicola]|nr:hypothetical protein N0V95_000709 [Ascochyta clinopodiicola]
MFNVPRHQEAVLFNTKTHSLSFNSSTPVIIAADELLIKVHSTAITRGELEWGSFVNWPDEQIPCYDVSGTIISAPTVSGSSHSFKEGDKVFGRIMANRRGAAQEYANILPSEAALVPKGLDMDSAACVPMSAHTAWQAIFEKGLLTGTFTPTSVPHVNSAGETFLHQAKGKRVLILGAASSVGSMGVQFVKLAGAFVTGTASAKNEEFLKGLNIDEIIDYTKSSVAEYVSSNDKFDIVFDCVGGQSMLDGWSGVKDDGVYVSVVPGFTEPEGGRPARVRTEWFVMESRSEELVAIGRFFEKGMLKVNVDSVWGLKEFRDAFEKTATGHARGKVVLKVGNEE